MIWDFKSCRGQHKYCSHLSWLKLTNTTNQAEEVITSFHSGVLKSLILQSLSCFWWISVQGAGGKLLSSKYVIGLKLVDINWFKVGRGGMFTFQGYCSRKDWFLMSKPLELWCWLTVFFFAQIGPVLSQGRNPLSRLHLLRGWIHILTEPFALIGPIFE